MLDGGAVNEDCFTTQRGGAAADRKAGFVEYAREPRALKIDGKYHDSVLMTLPFDPKAFDLRV